MMVKRGRAWGVSDPTYEKKAHALLKKDKDERPLSGCVFIHCLVQETLTHCADRQGKSCISLSGTFGSSLLKRGKRFIVWLEPWCHYSRHTRVKFQVASMSLEVREVTFSSSVVWTYQRGMCMHLPTHLNYGARSSWEHPPMSTCHFQGKWIPAFSSY